MISEPIKIMPDVNDDGFWTSPLIDRIYLSKLFGRTADIEEIARRYEEIALGHRPSLSLFFDADYYLTQYEDVATSGSDPLRHFYQYGFWEGRSPHPLIDLEMLHARYPDLRARDRGLRTFVDLLHNDVPPSPYFDLHHYVAWLPLIRAVGPDGYFAHYLEHDFPNGTAPNPYLDARWYAHAYPDAPIDGRGAIRHFIQIGDPAGRSASASFDGQAYLESCPSARHDFRGPLHHYLSIAHLNDRPPTTPVSKSGLGPMSVQPPAYVDTDVAYRRVRASIERRHERLIQEVREKDVRPVPPGDLADLLDRLAFAPGQPRISILIPIYNEFDYALEALASLCSLPDAVPFEVVIADDASTDPNVATLGDVPNLSYVRQPKNVGFLRNCNAALTACRGEMVLLLNSDTQVLPGALDAMTKVLVEDPGIGAVGPKLVYPNNRLQEAGCSIGSDAAANMTGIFLDPNLPAFSYDRDVQYCSGAALLIRRECLPGIIFDDRFRTAYYEDVDLCLRIIEQGYRIRYCAAATVVHHLSVSTTRESQSKKLQQVFTNQQRLLERWQEPLAKANHVRVIALYLPQFHPTQQNNLWWGEGFTEWTNVASARPSYDRHYQPHLPADLGFYDLRLPNTAARQAKLAKRYGIEGFCVYYYRFSTGRVLDEAIDTILTDKSIDFPFCLCWANENWTKHWDGGSHDVLLEQDYSDQALKRVCEDFVTYARDPRYITIDGAPIFLLYRPLLLPDPLGFSTMLRRMCDAAGLPDPHLVYVEGMETAARNIRPSDFGFDASVEFPPQGRATPATDPVRVTKEGWAGNRYDYEQTIVNFTHRFDADYPRYPSVFPSWDNTPRQPLLGTSFDGASPGAFQAYVEAKIDEINALHMGERRILFVNAWNEWAEGAHLEPDTRYGHDWLAAINRALRAKGALS